MPEQKKRFLVAAEKGIKTNKDRWSVGFAYLNLFSDPQSALRIAQDMQAADPKDADGFLLAGYAYQRIGEKEKALLSFKKVTELAPDFRDGWLISASILSDLGRHIEAFALLKEYLKRLEDKKEPPANNTYLNLGWYAYLAGDRKAAREYTGKCLELNPTEPNALYNLALIDAEEENLESAVAVYGKAIVVDSDRILLEAIKDLRDSITRNPRIVSIHYALGMLLEARIEKTTDPAEKKTLREEALKAYETYVARSKDTAWIEKAKDRLVLLKKGE